MDWPLWPPVHAPRDKLSLLDLPSPLARIVCQRLKSALMEVCGASFLHVTCKQTSHHKRVYKSDHKADAEPQCQTDLSCRMPYQLMDVLHLCPLSLKLLLETTSWFHSSLFQA